MNTILVNLNRCTGCWTCSMACKVVNNLDDKTWWHTVRTKGSGEGIDRPDGVWPNLSMSWQPVWSKNCILCSKRVSDGDLPYCVFSCPNEALFFGDTDDANSAISKAIADYKAKGYRLFPLPGWEDSKEGIIYAKKG